MLFAQAFYLQIKQMVNRKKLLFLFVIVSVQLTILQTYYKYKYNTQYNITQFIKHITKATIYCENRKSYN